MRREEIVRIQEVQDPYGLQHLKFKRTRVNAGVDRGDDTKPLVLVVRRRQTMSIRTADIIVELGDVEPAGPRRRGLGKGLQSLGFAGKQEAEKGALALPELGKESDHHREEGWVQWVKACRIDVKATPSQPSDLNSTFKRSI